MSINETSSTMRKIVDLSKSIENTRFKSISRYSIKSIFDEFEENMIEITKKTSRSIRKNKSKKSKKDFVIDTSRAFEMNLFKHSYYQKKRLDNSSEVKIES